MEKRKQRRVCKDSQLQALAQRPELEKRVKELQALPEPLMNQLPILPSTCRILVLLADKMRVCSGRSPAAAPENAGVGEREGGRESE